MLKNLSENLSKTQKIVILVLLQVLFLALLVLTVRAFTTDESPVVIDNESADDSSIPKNARNFIADNIWEVIKENIQGVTKNTIDDVVIREDTYDETVLEDGSVWANFIVDIDSLKQSYIISTGWSKDGETVYEVNVNCPPVEKMKYQETICKGTYNNTFSLDLYLPYIMYPDGYDEENADGTLAPNYMITGDDKAKTLDILVSTCDAERFKQEAWKYLNSLPVDFSDYTVNYEVNSIDVDC